MSLTRYIYFIANKSNSTLYIGVTSNIQKRLWEHRNKITKGFSQKYNCYKLVYYEIYDDPNIAIAREKSLKNLVRLKKNALVEKDNPSWADLAFGILSPLAPE